MRFQDFVRAYFAALAANPDETFLSFDVETAYSTKRHDESEFDSEEVLEDWQIIRVSFSYEPFTAVSIPWSEAYMPGIRQLLEANGPKVGWNCRTFDIPVIARHNIIVQGLIFDAQDAYHLLQSDLPKGLEWVSSFYSDVLPWKHMGSANPMFYSAADADIALRNFFGIRADLQRTGQWDLFLNHVVRLMPLLDYAGKHGNRVDRMKRDEIRSKLIAMRDSMVEEIQAYVPRELFPRKEYKTQPEAVPGDFPIVAAWTEGSHLAPSGVALERWDVRYELADAKFCTNCGKAVGNFAEHLKGGKKNNVCKAADGKAEKRPAWLPRFDQLEPFNPNSSDQLKSYMRHFGHPIGRDKRDSSKETADAGHLKSLVKTKGAKFPIYSKTLVVHKVSKTIGTYTPEPDANDLIHTQYVNSTATWRLGSRKVEHGTQIQNWGKRKDETPTENEEEKASLKLAGEARKQIVPRVGHKLVQIDSSAVEAVMQGSYMIDVDYMNLASKSIHAWLSCKKLGLEFTPENVDFVKDHHAGLYSKMKVTNYLTNFGGGPRLMHDTYPDDFPTLAVAQQTQDDLYALLPSLKEYHHSVRWEAHTKTFLTTPWGYRHWYYDVFKRKFDGSISLSKDSKRCVAFKPQNSNAAFQKDNLLLVGYSPIEGEPVLTMEELDRRWLELSELFRQGRTWGTFYGANVSIHDSLCLDCPIPLVERATQVLLAVFTRPIPEMNGLIIGAEVEVGDDWKDMTRSARIVPPTYTLSDTAAGAPRALAEAA